MRAEEKAETEAKARAEAEKTGVETRGEAEKQAKVEARSKARAEERARLEAEARLRAEREAKSRDEEKINVSRVAIPAIEEATIAEYQQGEKAEAKSKTEIIGISGKRGTCECCGKKGVPKDKLLKIDSGQLFCPNCLHALRSSGVS